MQITLADEISPDSCRFWDSDTKKKLDKDVGFYEPEIALNGGCDGYSKFREIIYKSSVLIKKKGKLFLEIGYNQKNEVIRILNCNKFYINKVVKDLGKKNRCIISTKI